MKKRTGFREIKVAINNEDLRDLEGVSLQVIRDHDGKGGIDGFDGQIAVRISDSPAVPTSFDILRGMLGTEQIVKLTIGHEEIEALGLISEGYALRTQGDSEPSKLMAPIAAFGIGLCPGAKP